MKKLKKKNFKKLKMSEKEYLGTHLKGMAEVKKRWYMIAMKTWDIPSTPREEGAFILLISS
jgi:hypothetical protein